MAINEKQEPCVLLGITGCIAAYKACELLRMMQKSGLRVKVVMTEHATHFVTPTTFKALTHDEVAVDLFDHPSDPIHHVSLAQEADVFVIAPCTGNVLAKIAHGEADDLLTTTALATKAPLVIAPAMNVNMYENPLTQDNMKVLREKGVSLVEAGEGYLACGDTGKGRLAELQDILDATLEALRKKDDLSGLSLMITAGPTLEPIDPVRYISNRSSGKTGYAIARAAAKRGANVTLVSGPTAIPDPDGVRVIRVETACEMLEAAQAAFQDCDIAVFSAAVADVRPAHHVNRKLKKGTDDSSLKSIELVRNPDILATLGAEKGKRLVIGFAAETDHVIENAQEKLKTKNADLIIANKVGEGLAFGTEENQVTFVSADEIQNLPLMPKSLMADCILDKALSMLQ